MSPEITKAYSKADYQGTFIFRLFISSKIMFMVNLPQKALLL